MKTSLIVFVIVLAFVVLDLIEALPAALPQQGKGKALGAKGADGANGANFFNNPNGKFNGKFNNKKPPKNNNPPQDNNAGFCNGKDPTDGLQKLGGSCSNTVQGDIPSLNNMVSTIFTSPKNGDVLKAKKPIQLKLAVSGLETGHFDDPDTEYYKNPQTLNGKGQIKGHSHVTVQKLVSNNQPPNPIAFDFFKGLDEPAVNGVLSATIDNGLAPGNYRACSMTSSQGHQPVLMPKAKRGSQDDCIRFTVA